MRNLLFARYLKTKGKQSDKQFHVLSTSNELKSTIYVKLQDSKH